MCVCVCVFPMLEAWSHTTVGSRYRVLIIETEPACKISALGPMHAYVIHSVLGDQPRVDRLFRMTVTSSYQQHPILVPYKDPNNI